MYYNGYNKRNYNLKYLLSLHILKEYINILTVLFDFEGGLCELAGLTLPGAPPIEKYWRGPWRGFLLLLFIFCLNYESQYFEMYCFNN